MSQRTPSMPKLTLLTCIILTGMLIVGAFQNCAHSPKQNNVLDSALINRIQDPEVRQIDRFPSSELGDMIRSSEQDISKTQNVMQGQGNFQVGRNLANTKELDFGNPDPSEKKDSMKIKLKTKKTRR